MSHPRPINNQPHAARLHFTSKIREQHTVGRKLQGRKTSHHGLSYFLGAVCVHWQGQLVQPTSPQGEATNPERFDSRTKGQRNCDTSRSNSATFCHFVLQQHDPRITDDLIREVMDQMGDSASYGMQFPIGQLSRYYNSFIKYARQISNYACNLVKSNTLNCFMSVKN